MCEQLSTTQCMYNVAHDAIRVIRCFIVFLSFYSILYMLKPLNSVIPQLENAPLTEFMYLVFTRMPGESYRRQLRSLLLYLCYI